MAKPVLRDSLKNRKGQVVVEYVLILFVAVSCAAFLTEALIDRDPTEPGKIISAWNKILSVIGNDLPDCSGQDSFNRAECN